MKHSIDTTYDTSCRSLPRLLLLLLLVMAVVSPALSQPILKATAGKDTIRIGEPLQVRLTAVWPGKPESSSGFMIPDSIPHFDVWERQQPVPIQGGLQQTITITSYDSGMQTLPPFSFISNEAKPSSAALATDPIKVMVVPVNVDTLQDYHDIKDIIEVPPAAQWPYVLGIGLMTLAAIIGSYLLLRRAGIIPTRPKTDLELIRDPFEHAMQQLQQLQDGISTSTDAASFYTRLIIIHRAYLHQAFQFRSLQQTGGELILQAKPLLPEHVFFPMAETIRLSDAVKFARHEPAREVWTTSVTHIRNTIVALHERTPTSS